MYQEGVEHYGSQRLQMAEDLMSSALDEFADMQQMARV
jgi:hypothetical protein